MSGREDNLLNCYADRLPYKIEKAAIYMKLRGSCVLNGFDAGLSIDQFITLETIAFNPGICQRDLSKIVLKDRSNITRILNILEDRGLIIRELSVKGRRPVKTMKLTESGEEMIKKYSSPLEKDMDVFLSDFSEEELEVMKRGLDKIIGKISEMVSIQI